MKEYQTTDPVRLEFTTFSCSLMRWGAQKSISNRLNIIDAVIGLVKDRLLVVSGEVIECAGDIVTRSWQV